MGISLPDDIAIKIERAEELIQQIDEICSEYIRAAPVRLVPVRGADDPASLVSQDGSVVWGVKAEVAAPPPRKVRALIGDAVNNIRSALDYLARALVVTSGNNAVDEGHPKTQWPIVDHSRDVAIAGGVLSEALNLVQQFQPRADGLSARHPLALLRELSNQDKHRAPLVVVGGLAIPAAFLISTNRPEGRVGVASPLARWLRDGEWAVMPVFPFLPNDLVAVDGRVSTSVSFPSEGPLAASVADDLDYILRFVRGSVIPTFRPYFDEPWPDDVFAMENPVDPLETMNQTLDLLKVKEQITSLLASATSGQDGASRIVGFTLTPYVNYDPRLSSF